MKNDSVKYPAAVLFDWDNTLVDTWPVLHKALESTFEAFNLPSFSFDEVKENTQKPLKESFPEIFGNRWQEASEVYYSAYRRLRQDHFFPLPGAEELLESLCREGVYLAIVSHKIGSELRSEVSRLGWDIFFKKILGAGDCEKDKPSPLCVQEALSLSSVTDHQDVWFVGDMPVDHECAIQAGCVPVNVSSRPWNSGLHVSGCIELLSVFKKLVRPQ